MNNSYIYTLLVSFILNIMFRKILQNISVFIGILLTTISFTYFSKNKGLVANFKIDSNIEKKNFTLIIPVKNEENNIENCISSLININYPLENYEVIIINDNSTDHTLTILNNLTLPNNFKIINRQREGGFVSGVLNDALDNVSDKSEIIGVIDSDCIVSENILINLCNHFYKFDGGVQILEWHYNKDTNYLTKLLHLLCIHENYYLKNEFKVGHFYTKRCISVFKEYNENSILEDKELSIKFNNNNIIIKKMNDVLIYRTFPTKMKNIYSQQYRYALGNQIINFGDNIIQSDIILPHMIINELIISLLIKDRVIIRFLVLLSILIINILNYSFKNFNELYSHSAYKNAPKNIIVSKNLIQIYDYLPIVLSVYFIYLIKLGPFHKLYYNIEKIVWNRFI